MFSPRVSEVLLFLSFLPVLPCSKTLFLVEKKSQEAGPIRWIYEHTDLYGRIW